MGSSEKAQSQEPPGDAAAVGRYTCSRCHSKPNPEAAQILQVRPLEPLPTPGQGEDGEIRAAQPGRLQHTLAAQPSILCSTYRKA